MLMFEAKAQIDERLKLKDEYKAQIPEYIEALEIASKAIEAQIRLADLLNDFYAEDDDKHKDDMYSRALTLELLESIKFDYVEETYEETED